MWLKVGVIGLLLIGCLTRCKVVVPASLQPMGEVISPEDNPLTLEKAAFGRDLFLDKRLSIDESVSCAVCHKPFLAFSDGLKVSDGFGDKKATRNAPSVVNMAFSPVFMMDGVVPTLEMQALIPILDHNEMGMTMEELMQRLEKDSVYQAKSKKLFQRSLDPFVITRALAAFQRYLVSDNSRFDQYYYGKNKKALTKNEKQGWELFSNQLNCIECHPAPHFTTYKPENNGTYIEGDLDKGRFRATGNLADLGKFKTPSLRNVELTAPYMHDGRFETIWEVINHYENGGNKNSNQHPSLKPFKLNELQKKQLQAFLFSLTDESYFEKLALIVNL